MAYERNEQRCEGCGVAQVFKDGGTHVVERSAPTDKGIIYVEITASPLRDSTGNIVAGIEVVHDITKRKQSEEAIRQSEIRYRSLFDNMLEGFAYCRMLFDDNRPHDFIYLHVNSAFKKLTGLTDVVGKKVTEVLPGIREAHPELFESYGRVALTGNPERVDVYLDPLKVWLSISVYSTQKGYFVAVFDDITERKRLAEMNEERIRIAEFGVDIGAILNTGESDKLILRSCTNAMVKHLDAAFARIWTLDETKTVLELQASSGMYAHIDGPHSRLPIDKKAKIPLIAFTRQPNLTNNVVGDPSITEQEWAMREGIVSFAGYPLIVEDRLLGVIGMFARKPLSEFVLKALEVVAGNIALGIVRKHSEIKLAKYSNELTSLNMASNTLMIITNLRDIYQEICNIIYSVFDLKMAWLGLIEEGSFDIKAVAYAGSDDDYLSNSKVTWDDSPTGMGPTGMAIKTRATFNSNINDPSFAPWKSEAQKRGYVAFLAVPLIYARDKCIGALNFCIDRSDYFTPDRVKLCQIFANQAAIAIENARLIEGLEEKVVERTRQIEDTNIELQTVNRELVQRREEAEAGSRSKSDFLANMSHELRTPLNAVIGLSQVLLEQTFGPLNAKQSEYLEGVRQSGDHLLSLINEILDLSKIEAGKEQFEPAVFSMLDTLRNAFMFVKEKAMKHGIELSQEIGPEVGLFYADERRVKQILFNLLSNAVKFTEPGGKVVLKAGQDEHAFTLTVRDTGVGIPDNKRHLIFQPFQQLDGSLSRKHEGTGLGLVLSKRLVEMHGGTITFESDQGGGTIFTVTLPVRRDKQPGTQTHIHQSEESPQRTRGLTAGKRIMIVEDNHLNMLLVADFLRGKAFEVVEAATGEVALEKASQERPDIILLDIQMPGIDGFEVIRRLRENDALKGIPVIAMTALAMKGDEERCIQAGFNDYISKPVNLHEVLRKIDRSLGRSG
jgi:PAS domain S-box-containing protein